MDSPIPPAKSINTTYMYPPRGSMLFASDTVKYIFAILYCYLMITANAYLIDYIILKFPHHQPNNVSPLCMLPILLIISHIAFLFPLHLGIYKKWFER